MDPVVPCRQVACFHSGISNLRLATRALGRPADPRNTERTQSHIRTLAPPGIPNEPNPISGHFGSSAGLRTRLPHAALSFGFVGVVVAIVFGAVIIIVALAVLLADFVQDDAQGVGP
jgi:hypothetical protein